MDDNLQAKVSYFRWYTFFHWLIWLCLIAGFIWTADWFGSIGIWIGGTVLVLIAPSAKELWVSLTSKEKIRDYVAQKDTEFSEHFKNDESGKTRKREQSGSDP